MAHFSEGVAASKIGSADTLSLLDLADLAADCAYLIHAIRMSVEILGGGDDQNALAHVANLAFEKATEVKRRIKDLHSQSKGLDPTPDKAYQS